MHFTHASIMLSFSLCACMDAVGSQLDHAARRLEGRQPAQCAAGLKAGVAGA